MQSVGIIGLGRFGKILANILQKGYSISAYDLNDISPITNINFYNLDKVLQERVIFIAVPIRNFESLIKKISPKLKSGTTLIDVCSVKSYPVNVMLKNINKDIGIISTHPMFGPDSFSTNTKLKMMMHKVRDPENQFISWRNYFSNQGIYVLRMGSIQEEFLKLKDEKIVDYANSELRCSILDIYLLSNSLFYFGSSSGLMNVSCGFQKKCYGINYVLPEFTRQHVPYLFIFKKIRNKKNNNFLSLKEVLESPFVDEIQKNNIDKYGYELVNNTDEEIYNLGIEAYKDYLGENVYDEESVYLLKKFYKIYHSYREKNYRNIDFLKISPFFLKNNKYLLN